MGQIADDTRYAFARLAIDYYGLGRFAVLTHSTMVAANLLHHAVEMILKAALAPFLGLAELKKISHSLSKLWLKLEPNGTALDEDRFRRTIAELDAFERIRYPDVGLKEGLEIMHAISRVSDPSSATWAKPEPTKYVLVLNDIDALFCSVCRAASINPSAFVPHDADRREWIKRSNPEASYLYPESVAA